MHHPRFDCGECNGLALRGTLALKKQLLAELLELEYQRDNLERSANFDFSMMQAYKEMIHSRRAMFQGT